MNREMCASRSTTKQKGTHSGDKSSKSIDPDALHVVRWNGCWQVFDGDRPVSGAIAKYEQALDTLDRERRKARIRIIPCLRCRAQFPSEGAHNRLCKACNEFAVGASRGAMA